MTLWRTLGAVAPARLADARLQLHHAAQVVASAGITWLSPQPDDSHPNMGWEHERHMLVGRALPRDGARVGLCVPDLSLAIVDSKGREADRLRLDDTTLEDAYVWLEESAVAHGVPVPDAGVARSPYDLPTHAVADGEVFSIADDGAALEELARWFANGFDVLAPLATRVGADAVRVWPHHFDAGSLIALETDARGRLVKSVGFGLSPGDAYYQEPYFYVSPWPYPPAADLPALELGHWHTDAFTGAILTGTELLRGAPEHQRRRAADFLDHAFDAGRSLLRG